MHRFLVIAAALSVLGLIAAADAQDGTSVERIAHEDDPRDPAVRRVLDRLGLRDPGEARQRGEVLVVEATDRNGVRRRMVLAMPSGAVLGDQVLSPRPRRD